MQKSVISNRSSLGYFTQKIFCVFFLLACLFPFTQIVPLDTYNQPYAILLGVLLFVAGGMRQVGNFSGHDQIALIILALIGLILFIFTCFPVISAQEIKYLLMYISPLVFSSVFLFLLIYYNEMVLQILKYAILVWAVVGVIQIFYSASFATGLVGSWQSSAQTVVDSGRGVIGLAPEPTHFGIHMLLMGALWGLLGGSRWLSYLAVAVALFIAQSASVFLLIFLAVAIQGLRKVSLKSIVYMIGITLLVYYTILRLGGGDDGSRVVSLLAIAIDDPFLLLQVDGSVNSRFGGLIASIMTPFSNYFLPNGLSYENWLTRMPLILEANPWLFSVSNSGWPSGYFILVEQIGLLGIAYLVFFIKRFLAIKADFWMSVIYVAALGVFFFQYYLSTPMFGLILAAIFFERLKIKESRAKEHEKLKENIVEQLS